MKRQRRKSDRPNPRVRGKSSTMLGVIASAAPLIAVFHSPALAATGPASNTTSVITAMDPASLVTATTAIASLGAYQLMKARARKRTDRKDPADS